MLIKKDKIIIHKELPNQIETTKNYINWWLGKINCKMINKEIKNKSLLLKIEIKTIENEEKDHEINTDNN